MKEILELEVLSENISLVLSVDLNFGLRWAGCWEERKSGNFLEEGGQTGRKGQQEEQ